MADSIHPSTFGRIGVDIISPGKMEGGSHFYFEIIIITIPVSPHRESESLRPISFFFSLEKTQINLIRK
jgi:hypothetical protein